MASEAERPAGVRPVAVALPWLIGAAALGLYAVTLNGWVSMTSVFAVARVSGWVWQPELIQPLIGVVFWPFHLVPGSWVAPALNWFSAGCGALALGLLARSAVLLPHDLPPEAGTAPRQLGTLGGAAAWFPPVLATAVCGLQLSFWEQATAATGQMVTLLVFAWVVLSLLEYRIDHREWRLWGCALVYAAGLANDWALWIYVPVFLVALARVKGLAVLNTRFLLRLGLWAAGGLSLYLVLPCVAAVSPTHDLGFWPALKLNLVFQRDSLRHFRHSGLEMLVLTVWVPLLVVSFPWTRITNRSGDNHPLGVGLTRAAIHLAHGLCLGAMLWMAFDAPLSARQLGTPAAPLVRYYVSALVAAFCAGHFLAAGAEARAVRLGLRRDVARRDSRRWVRVFARVRRRAACLAAAAVCLLGPVAPLGLAWRNLPQIRLTNGPYLREYARELYNGLPSGKSVVLSDDGMELFLLQAEMSGRHEGKAALLVDTRALGYRGYQRFLAAKRERLWGPARGVPGADQGRAASPLEVLSDLSTNGPTFYLHPSLDYCLEWFGEQPKGAVLRLVPRGANDEPGQRLDTAGAAANEHYWQERWTNSLEALAERPGSSRTLRPAWAARLCGALHLSVEPNRTLVLLGAVYARCLDGWGVRLERLGQWVEASVWFERALRLNPANLPAQLNLEYNQRRQRGDTARLALDKAEARFAGQADKCRTWTAAGEAYGPFDEPTSLFELGIALLTDGQARVAAREFTRCVELAPDWPEAGLGLVHSHLLLGDYAEVLRLTDGWTAGGKPHDPIEEVRMLACRTAALRGLGRGAEATGSIEGFTRANEGRPEALSAAAQLYLQSGRFGPALALVEQLLAQRPNDPSLLVHKGCAELGLRRWDAAIATLSKALELAPANPAARMNRAIAGLRAGRLEEARADYEALERRFPDSIQVLFGLGEIAWLKKETNAAIEDYQRYLGNGPRDSDEYKLVAARLKSLQGR